MGDEESKAVDGEGRDGQVEKEWLPFAEFLAKVPPNVEKSVEGVTAQDRANPFQWSLARPDVRLFCEGVDCNRELFFRSVSPAQGIRQGAPVDLFLVYVCRNCGKARKVYSLSVLFSESGGRGTARKYGEWPVFGPPTPSRVIKLMGEDREIFLKGRRCESQGLGVGAFAYYRRAVENQKGRIFGEVIKVAKKLGASAEVVGELEAGAKEPQFSRAVDMIRHGFPDGLLLNGHNPLKLLHGPLSAGLHAESEERCLELASSVRVVLTELAERMGQVMRDEQELNEAVRRLLAANTGKEGS